MGRDPDMVPELSGVFPFACPHLLTWTFQCLLS